MKQIPTTTMRYWQNWHRLSCVYVLDIDTTFSVL